MMAFRQRSGARTLKVVVAVAFAVRLAKLLPTSPCSLTPRPGRVRVFHYTNKAGYEGILESRCIQPSDIMQGDASYGSSVYATELDPSKPFWTILQNNYDMDGGIQGRGESRKDRADYVFAFDLDNSWVKFIDNEGRRSIACIGGGYMILVPGSVFKVLYSGKAAVAAAVLKNTRKKVLVYYYTNKQGYERNLASGYILPEDITSPDGRFQVSVVRGTLAHPSKPIYTILQNIYGEGGSSYGRGEDMLDRADYVFAFLLPVDMLEWVSFSQNTKKVLSIGRGKRVDITEAFYRGASADAFHETGLNHSVFKSEEEVRMYLQIDESVNTGVETYINVTSSDSNAVATSLPTSPCSLTPGFGRVRVFHYTNKAGYEGILESGCIRPSDIMQGDASYGSSVYATELDPSKPFWTILQNNYDMDGGIQGRGESRKDRADYVFAFDLDNSSVEFIDNEGRRSIACIGDGREVVVDDALYSGKAAIAAAVLRNTRKKVLVYHYTNKEGYERNLASGYILPENIAWGPWRGVDFVFIDRFVHGTLLDPSKPIYTILDNIYGGGGCFYGKGKDMLDRADYVFAFLLSVDMLEWVGHTRRILSIGGEAVEVAKAFYHGPAAEAFDDNGLNHSVFESEEEVRMYLQMYDSVSKENQTDDIVCTYLV